MMLNTYPFHLWLTLLRRLLMLHLLVIHLLLLHLLLLKLLLVLWLSPISLLLMVRLLLL